MGEGRVCGAWTEQWVGGQHRGYTCWKPVDGHTNHEATVYSYDQRDDEGFIHDLYWHLYEPYRWVAPVPSWHREAGDG